MNEWVALNDEMVAQTWSAAQARYDRRAKTPHRHGLPSDAWSVRREANAIGAEIAAATYLGLTWHDTPDPDHDGDIGYGLQVRSTPYTNGKLLIHPSDDPAHSFILVTGRLPTYRVRGWITAGAARRPEWWTELQPGRPCWAVPQDALWEIPRRQVA